MRIKTAEDAAAAGDAGVVAVVENAAGDAVDAAAGDAAPLQATLPAASLDAVEAGDERWDSCGGLPQLIALFLTERPEEKIAVVVAAVPPLDKRCCSVRILLLPMPPALRVDSWTPLSPPPQLMWVCLSPSPLVSDYDSACLVSENEHRDCLLYLYDCCCYYCR